MGIRDHSVGIRDHRVRNIWDHGSPKNWDHKRKKNLVTTLKGGTTPTGNRLKRPRIVLKLRTRRNDNLTLR